MRRLITLGVIIGAGLLAAGCTAGSGSTNSPSSTGKGKTSTNSVLVIDNENGELWPCNFNPFSESDNLLSVGFTYEPLVYVDPLNNGTTTPMLATSWTWGAGDMSLTFHIRQGVTFSNGQPFSANDVAFTFNLLKKDSSLDLNGVWPVLSSVTAVNSSTVVMDFAKPAEPYFYYIADQTPIVPESIWSAMKNPVANPVTQPIGTGPYLMTKCSPENITYTANPHYWQPGEPKVHTLQYPAYTSNNTANDDLANGQAQWGAQYIPDIQSFYVSKDPGAYHYWLPPITNVSLVPNLTNPLLGNLKVREAISYAIDRTKVSSIGESGYEPAANQTGVITPTFSADVDSSALASWGSAYDPAKATQLLNQAGFHLGSGGVMQNAAGQKLAFTVINVGDYSDWVSDMQVIQQDLKAVGISISPDNLSNNTFNNDLTNGEFQLAYYDQPTFGPSPWYELNNWLNSAASAPVGKPAGSNYERFYSNAADSILNGYEQATSTAAQTSYLDQLQQVMVSQVPIIPVVEAVDWYQYDTAAFSGWPTASDPYAQPPVWAYPDNEQVLLHLTPIG
jgi:peptide/nickel transport system substrate-binding protein